MIHLSISIIFICSMHSVYSAAMAPAAGERQPLLAVARAPWGVSDPEGGVCFCIVRKKGINKFFI